MNWDWLTVAQAAEHAHVSERTVRRWISERRLHASHVGRRLLVRRDRLDRFLEGDLLEPDELAALRLAVRRERWRRRLVDLLLVCLGFWIGVEIEELWTVDWHPLNVDIDSAAGILAALLVLLGGRAGIESLIRRRRRLAGDATGLQSFRQVRIVVGPLLGWMKTTEPNV